MSRLSTKVMPSIDYLNECLSYNPETGKLSWKKRPSNHFKNLRSENGFDTRFTDKEITSVLRGYVRFELDSSSFYGHRIAWKLFTGKDPVNDIDHINGNTLDNRIINLRECTHTQNMRNQGIRKTNTTGYKGVTVHTFKSGNSRFKATIRNEGKYVHLGLFDTALEASMAYIKAVELFRGEFGRVI